MTRPDGLHGKDHQLEADLRQVVRRRAQAPVDAGHPEPEELLKYHLGSLTGQEADRIEEHLGFCEDCSHLILDFAAFLHPAEKESELRASDLDDAWDLLTASLRQKDDLTLDAGAVRPVSVSRVNAPPWARLVLLIALAKAVAALAALPFHSPPDKPAFLAIFYPLWLLSFGAGAGLLLAGGRRDPRAVALGGFFLVTVTAFANTPIQHFVDEAKPEEPWASLLMMLLALRPDAFLAYFLWRFVRNFPKALMSPLTRRIMKLAVNVSSWAGAVLFLLSGASFVTHHYPERLPRLVARLVQGQDSMDPGTLLYKVVAPLAALALATLIWKTHWSAGMEHRRAHLFIFALSVLITPIIVIVICDIYVDPVIAYFARRPDMHVAVLWVGNVLAWSAPGATAYATLRYRVLDIRLIARRALRYALARYSAILLASVPLLAVAYYVHRHREEKVDDLLQGRPLLLLAAGAILGFFALRYRSRLLTAIDRRFFREQYDAQQILTRVVQRLRATHEVGKVAELLCRGVDQALHLENVAVLVEDPRSGTLVDPRSRARRLDLTSPLANLVGSVSDSLTVDIENPRSPLATLPDTDRHWLVDSGFQLIVPIVARAGSLLGLIGLGEKKSGLPFLREDRRLLYDIASSAALGLELEIKHSSRPGRLPDRRPFDLTPTDPAEAAFEPAKECANSTCGTLYPSYTVFCGHCSRKLDQALVPYILPGKFRFERRIGIGGTGVVYRALDLVLGRPVAVKTLRRVSPEDAMRLRREARTAASVSHPHLGAIYGAETWQGTPMLVLELMEKTLKERLEKGPLAPLEVVELGIAMASALERLHAAEILHRDIKPSNIGFTKDGVPKLMDFGIARVMWDLRREREDSDDDDEEDSRQTPTAFWADGSTRTTLQNQLVGTLSYLSPEALAGARPNPGFDLWSLSLVLFECVLGRKLFVGANSKQVVARIQLGRIPDLEQTHPDADPVLANFFRSALHRSPARRPGTARELRAKLEKIHEHLEARRIAG